MPALRKNVEFTKDSCLDQTFIEFQAILDWDGLVFLGMKQEGRWRLLGNMVFVRQALDEFLRGIITDQVLLAPFVCVRLAEANNRIAEDAEIGARRFLGDSILRGLVTIIEVRQDRRYEMAAS